MIRIRRSALAALFTLPLVASPLLGIKTWTIDDILKLKRLSNPVISPDGRHVLYGLAGMRAAENSRYSDLFVVTSDGRTTRRLTEDDRAETSQRWSPDSSFVSYLADKQIWLVAPTRGKPRQITSVAEGVLSYAWSPDDSRLLYLAGEPKSRQQIDHEKEWGAVISPEEEWPERASLWMMDVQSRSATKLNGDLRAPISPQWSPDGASIAFLCCERDDKPPELYIVEAAKDAKPRRVTESDIGVRLFSWSPDGASIAYVTAVETPPPYVNYFRRHTHTGAGAIWTLDVGTGSSRQVSEASYRSVRELLWSPDGGKLSFLALDPGRKQGMRPPQRVEAFYVLSVKGGEARSAAEGLDFCRGAMSMTWSADNREIWFLNGDRMGFNVYAVDVESGKVRNVTTGQDCIGSLTYSKDFSRAAFVNENANAKPDVYVTSLPDWRPEKITDFNPEVRDYAHGPGEIVQYPSEGRTLDALVVKPPDFDPRKKYPLILIVHGGPAWHKKNDWKPYWEQQPIQAYAAEGYVLVFPNFRGSVHFGTDLRLANYGELGKGDHRDCMAAVDHLIAQGFVDEKRLGVAGWSYGGYLVPAIITQTNRFQAAQFGASITSVESMYARLSTVEFILDANIGVFPWEDVDTMAKFSPLYSADKITTPTLIQHGEDDPRCPVGASILFYKALKFYNVPAVLEIYPKEGHGIQGPLLVRRCLRRNLEWFNKWLKGDETTSFEMVSQ